MTNTETVSTERLREILAGLEGVTPGPWVAQDVSLQPDDVGSAYIVGANLGGLVGGAHAWPSEIDDGDFERVEANAAHIARCDPDTIRSIITELLASRTQSPAEWRTDVHDGAAACHVMAARWDEEGGEWIVDIVMAPPGKPWTHWRHLGKEEVDIEATAENIARNLSAIDGGRFHKPTYNAAKAGAIEGLKCALSALETPPLHKEGEAVAWRWRVKGDQTWTYDPAQGFVDKHIADPTMEFERLYASPVPVPVTITDGWPEAPEGWQRTKPTYVRSDGTLRVEFIYGRERSPWCVSWSLGNGACASLSYHATPQEALDAALATKVTGDATGTAAALSVKPGEPGEPGEQG